MVKWLISWFDTNRTDSTDKPLIVVGIGRTLENGFGEINKPLYHRLAKYSENGAEIVLASDGAPGVVTDFKNKLEHEGLDARLFTQALTPRTNNGLGKGDDAFWPKLLKRYKRMAEQVVLIDDDRGDLRNAYKHAVRTFHPGKLPSSEESLLQLDDIIRLLNP